MNAYLFISGLLAWTLMEYTLHRFLFHAEDKWLPHNNLAMTMHFLFHGIHHAFPMDKLRLVFPPQIALFLYFTIFRPLYSTILDDHYYPAVMAGTMIGYTMYEMVHYWSHHFELNCNHLKSMKKYHMVHHYRNGEAGFGVSVLHIVNKAPSGWVYGYFSTGDPEDANNKIENLALDMETQLDVTVQGQSVASVDITIAYSFSPLVIVTEACATRNPTQNPSANPL